MYREALLYWWLNHGSWLCQQVSYVHVSQTHLFNSTVVSHPQISLVIISLRPIKMELIREEPSIHELHVWVTHSVDCIVDLCPAEL